MTLQLGVHADHKMDSTLNNSTQHNCFLHGNLFSSHIRHAKQVSLLNLFNRQENERTA